jgi:hypothetical protein
MQFADWVSTLTLAAVLTCLLYFVLVWIAAYASTGVPGWYIHAYAPALAPLLGFALAGMHAFRHFRWIFVLLLLYPSVFFAEVMALQGAIFAGCVDKKVDAPIPNFTDAPCATDLSMIFERLSVLAYPGITAVLFALGMLLMVIGVVAALRIIFFDQTRLPNEGITHRTGLPIPARAR